jgi:hypothetical protein
MEPQVRIINRINARMVAFYTSHRLLANDKSGSEAESPPQKQLKKI